MMTEPVLRDVGTPVQSGRGRSVSACRLRFINDRTGHGMFVSIENVYSF
jgi:hypothetical protein